ncbi:Planctomycete cytochrome C [Rubripirellula amarantea]|uniref:Planctomycete cytochrome C n=1 Tax=Rubripirellula amarantea TaxID=2527999 RepID=A0A5C5WF04_9BACT|nr:PSD1 and planctomycete cytochrome C domain-containing protein [Rubripirellula amarantea]TWT49334.1 Planctomycete cytochrome C [Rubripirellula amarantea]
MKLHTGTHWFAVGLSTLFVLASQLQSQLSAEDAAPPTSAHSGDGEMLRLPKTVTFNEHIRPIMSGTCFACHGPDEESNESGLRLDSFELATEESIVPGDAKSSLVYQRLESSDSPMPPVEFRHQLSNYEKALFAKWIDDGAKYEEHWSLTPLDRPAFPSSGLKTSSEQTNPIDHFIIAKCTEAGLSLSDTADKATLLRRLSLDLIGLPPTLEELEDFLLDESDEAYERQVDRLLASPHYGERMAAPWLDIVRFSDTVGYHGDQNARIFPYRDYVIDSLNENKPFDQFTLEQLAGDLLDNPTESQLVATGLIRLNMVTREGGAQPGEYLAKYKADRVRMLGTAWLGSTTGCCECHNHKFDPFSIKDFYSLGAFFDDVQQWGVYSEYEYTPNKDLRGFSNDYPFPPEIRIRSKSLDPEIALLEREADSAISRTIVPSTSFDETIKPWALDLADYLAQYPTGWMPVTPSSIDVQHDTNVHTTDSAVTVSVDPKKTDVITWRYKASEPISIRAIELKVLPDEINGMHVGRANEGRFSVQVSAGLRSSTSEDETPIAIAFAQADRQNPSQYVSGEPPLFLEDVWRSGPARWQLPADETKLPHTAVYHLDQLVSLKPGDELLLRLASDDIGKFEVSFSPLTRYVAGQPCVTDTLSKALRQLQSDATIHASGRDAIIGAYYRQSTATNKQDSRVLAIRDQILKCRSGLACSLVSQPVEPAKIPVARVLPRGNWQDETGEIVTPAFPEFMVAGTRFEKEPGRRLTRKDLAQWLTSDENPLVARHYVNRTWEHFFGVGLSAKLDDLGNQGEWPSHPQLLDWLATEFRESWDMKHIARLIVTSDTYRQVAAKPTNSDSPNLAMIDPHNRLLSQQSARRLEAEIVRDNALSISGLLNREFVGGRSVMPYQPEGYYGNLQFPNREYEPDETFRRYRRGVYMHWQRTFLHPMLVNFDAPSRDECVADRIESNSPQQALTLLNDPTFVEASRAFADRLIREISNGDIDAQTQRAFQIALSRLATDEELQGLRQLYSTQLKHFTESPDDAKQYLSVGVYQSNVGNVDQAHHAALSQVCRVILNLHETITRF